MAIGSILLMDIILVVILLMAIGAYSTNGNWWLFW